MEPKSAHHSCQREHLLLTELFPAKVWLLSPWTVEMQFCDGRWNPSPCMEWERAQSTDLVIHMALPELRGGAFGNPPVWLSLTRNDSHAKEFLKGYSGYLEPDSYQEYNNLPGIRRCSCWMYIRWYFIDFKGTDELMRIVTVYVFMLMLSARESICQDFSEKRVGNLIQIASYDFSGMIHI